jgi:hypothetical protein
MLTEDLLAAAAAAAAAAATFLADGYMLCLS